jgi:hypothetical protein
MSKIAKLILILSIFLCGCSQDEYSPAYSARKIALFRVVWQHGYEHGKRNKDIHEGWTQVEKILLEK